MNKLIYLIFLFLIFPLKGLSQEIIDPVMENSEIILEEQPAPVDSLSFSDDIEIVLPQYPEWERATLNGKIKMKGLPISPNVRIFMIKDSLIEISTKVPFMGEVGRITLDNDSIIGINKMNKTYTSSGIPEISNIFPGGLSNIQSLLLERVFIPGFGDINENIAENISFYLTEDGFAVVPEENIKIPGYEYGYAVDWNFIPLEFLALPDYLPDSNFMIDYSNSADGYEMNFSINSRDKTYGLTLQLKNPEWTGEPLKKIGTEKKYKYLSLGEFIKSFGK